MSVSENHSIRGLRGVGFPYANDNTDHRAEMVESVTRDDASCWSKGPSTDENSRGRVAVERTREHASPGCRSFARAIRRELCRRYMELQTSMSKSLPD